MAYKYIILLYSRYIYYILDTDNHHERKITTNFYVQHKSQTLKDTNLYFFHSAKLSNR